MDLKVVLDKGAFLPVREHNIDAGMDIMSMHDVTIQPHSSAIVETGVHVELPENTAGLLVSKSGLNVTHDITSTGLIDQGYTGAIKVKLYNHGDKPYKVKAGDKVSQLVVFPVWYTSIELVQELNKSERGNNGFGSTGK